MLKKDGSVISNQTGIPHINDLTPNFRQGGD